MTIWRMRIACCVRKAADTHTEYVLLIAFPVQQWLHERASLLQYTYIACLVLTETDRVYCSVRAESLTTFQANRGTALTVRVSERQAAS
jgi:hypothetical protein